MDKIEIKVNCTPSIEQYQQTKTILRKSQTQSENRYFFSDGVQYRIKVNLRYDDECGNGYNSFGITANIDCKAKNGHWKESSCGCLHEEIAKYFPKLTPFIKWHLMSTNEPLHYIENALYHAGLTKYKEAKNEDYLKSTIIFGALESDYAVNWINLNKTELTERLQERLPLLVKEFRKAMESLGFIY